LGAAYAGTKRAIIMSLKKFLINLIKIPPLKELLYYNGWDHKIYK